MSEERTPVDGAALGVMVLLTALWGFQQVTVKWIAADVPLVMQAALRSIIATVLLLGWARLRGVALFGADGTGRAGLAAGLLFAGEFVFIYAGLAHTNASRMSVFIYLAPPLTALGLHWFVPSERLSLRQWAGVLLAFAGIVAAFAAGSAVTAVGQDSGASPVTYTLRLGDWAVMPGIGLKCQYIRAEPRPWAELDCGRIGTRKYSFDDGMDGIRVEVGSRWAEIYHWTEGEDWKLLARVPRAR